MVHSEKKIPGFFANIGSKALCLAIALSAFLYPISPKAQTLNDKVATPEQVAFTFYKLSETKPDFKSWVEKSEIPRYVTVAEYPAYKRALLRQLISMYEAYNPEKFLTIRVNATISLRTEPDYEKFYSPEKPFKPGADISLGDTKKTPYFPYQVADQWITVIVRDIDRALSVDLSEDDVGKFQHAFRIYRGVRDRPMTLLLTLKPLSADAKAPLHMNGIDQWLLMTEIVNASFWNAEGELVWEVQDRNYVSPDQKEIEDLFRE